MATPSSLNSAPLPTGTAPSAEPDHLQELRIQHRYEQARSTAALHASEDENDVLRARVAKLEKELAQLAKEKTTTEMLKHETLELMIQSQEQGEEVVQLKTSNHEVRVEIQDLENQVMFLVEKNKQGSSVVGNEMANNPVTTNKQEEGLTNLHSTQTSKHQIVNLPLREKSPQAQSKATPRTQQSQYPSTHPTIQKPYHPNPPPILTNPRPEVGQLASTKRSRSVQPNQAAKRAKTNAGARQMEFAPFIPRVGVDLTKNSLLCSPGWLEGDLF
ncbi:hypothetical protein FKW77_007828 [Venturia effusa]|uniref:Uncharacterized protein n=1 Tax=Venturia effusa TaxID=50376 RepID=A0A517L9M6_9PEZI|nr:hypothetical protein FKW77_007828 [Venturia effusa]